MFRMKYKIICHFPIDFVLFKQKKILTVGECWYILTSASSKKHQLGTKKYLKEGEEFVANFIIVRFLYEHIFSCVETI